MTKLHTLISLVTGWSTSSPMPIVHASTSSQALSQWHSGGKRLQSQWVEYIFIIVKEILYMYSIVHLFYLWLWGGVCCLRQNGPPWLFHPLHQVDKGNWPLDRHRLHAGLPQKLRSSQKELHNTCTDWGRRIQHWKGRETTLQPTRARSGELLGTA